MTTIPIYSSKRMFARVIPSTSEVHFFSKENAVSGSDLHVSHAQPEARLVFGCSGFSDVTLEYNVAIDLIAIPAGHGRLEAMLEELNNYGRVIERLSGSVLFFQTAHLTNHGMVSYVDNQDPIIDEIVDGRR